MVQTTGSLAADERKPRQGLRKSSNVIPPPLPGLTTLLFPTGGLRHRLISVMPPASGNHSMSAQSS